MLAKLKQKKVIVALVGLLVALDVVAAEHGPGIVNAILAFVGVAG